MEQITLQTKVLSEQQGLQKRCSSVAKTFCTLHFSAYELLNTTLHKSKIGCSINMSSKNKLIHRNCKNDFLNFDRYPQQMINRPKIFQQYFNVVITSFVISHLSDSIELFNTSLDHKQEACLQSRHSTKRMIESKMI